MAKLSIRDLDLKDKRVFIRVDFNVPLAPGGQEISSDKRIKASLPTIKYALEHGAGLVLASHLGRPKGKVNPEMSLKPVAARLAELLGKPVKMAPDCIGPEVEAMKPAPGEILLLENLRFHPEEEKNDPEFAKKLASLCDIYVNDAFGTAHRAHASTVGMIQFVPKAAAGLLMEKELEYLGMVTTKPPRPCVAILGGAKVSDKIEVIQNLMKFVDKLLIGGAMAYTFMKAQGKPTGKSLVEDDKVDLAKQLLAERGDKLMLPLDHVVAEELKEGAANEVVETIPDGKMGLDIGPKTVDALRPGNRRRQDASSGTARWASSKSRPSTKARWRCQGRGRIRRGLRGRRRRFREGHQIRRRRRQDLATSPPAAAPRSIPLRHRTAGRRGADGQDGDSGVGC